MTNPPSNDGLNQQETSTGWAYPPADGDATSQASGTYGTTSYGTTASEPPVVQEGYLSTPTTGTQSTFTWQTDDSADQSAARQEAGRVADAAGTEASKVANTAGTEASKVADTAKAEGQAVKDTAVAAAGNVAGTAKDELTEVTQHAQDQLRGLIDQGRDELRNRAGDTHQVAASTVRGLSDEISAINRGESTNGPVAQVLNQVAQRGEALSSWLEHSSPDDVVREVRRYAARRPVAFLAIAAGAGLLAGRFARGAKALNDDDTAVRSVTASRGPGGLNDSRLADDYRTTTRTHVPAQQLRVDTSSDNFGTTTLGSVGSQGYVDPAYQSRRSVDDATTYRSYDTHGTRLRDQVGNQDDAPAQGLGDNAGAPGRVVTDVAGSAASYDAGRTRDMTANDVLDAEDGEYRGGQAGTDTYRDGDR